MDAKPDELTLPGVAAAGHGAAAAAKLQEPGAAVEALEAAVQSLTLCADRVITRAELARHCTVDDVWMSVDGKVRARSYSSSGAHSPRGGLI